MKIARLYAGRKVRIPVVATFEDPIAFELGLEVANKVVKDYAGQTLEFPPERMIDIEGRNAEILKAIAPVEEGGEGLSHGAAGLRFGLTRQQIGNIAREDRERQEVAAA